MTLEDFQAHLNRYTRPLLNRWWLVLLLAGLLGGLMWGYSHTKETIYTATTSFLPEKGSKQSVSLDPLANLLGGGGFQSSGGEEISGVLKSRYLSEKVASDSLNLRGEQMLIADALLRYYLVERFYWTKLYKGSPEISEIPYESKIISAGNMIRSGLRIRVDDYKFLQMRFTYGDPDIVEAVSNAAIVELKSYLQDKRTEKDSLDYHFFQAKSDSVRALVEANAAYIARFTDRARFGTRAVDQLEAERRKIENEGLIQVLKQYELSREKSISQIQKNTPYIQILDAPKPPFQKLEPNKLTYIATGIFLGFLLTFLWVSRRELKADFVRLLERALA